MPAEKKPATAEEALHTILKHPLRKQLLRLIVEAGEELRSPKELTVPVDRSISSVGYHVRVLAEYGAVALNRQAATSRLGRALLRSDLPRRRSGLGAACPRIPAFAE
ncbi:MAG TPA: helix-turn-helix domain-containing protein [Solirubrobacterales bacterium]|nr:helix-turn-helix domain-containing protein [Solirubrobacterales bacterium]